MNIKKEYELRFQSEIARQQTMLLLAPNTKDKKVPQGDKVWPFPWEREAKSDQPEEMRHTNVDWDKVNKIWDQALKNAETKNDSGTLPLN